MGRGGEGERLGAPHGWWTPRRVRRTAMQFFQLRFVFDIFPSKRVRKRLKSAGERIAGFGCWVVLLPGPTAAPHVPDLKEWQPQAPACAWKRG